jgi:hypothetical protein
MVVLANLAQLLALDVINALQAQLALFVLLGLLVPLA